MLMTIMAFYVHLYPHVSHYWVSAPAISVIINNKGHQNSFVIRQRSLLYHQRYHGHCSLVINGVLIDKRQP